MRSMSRDLFLGHSRFMACYASNKFFFYFLPKIMAGIVWNASKRMSMQWHAFRCISGIRQIYNFRWSASALADHQKLSVWFVFLAWIEGTLSTRVQFGFHIFKSCILTESHVTKIDFFPKKSKVLTSHFSIAYDDFNDIYDDMNPSLYCLPILRAWWNKGFCLLLKGPGAIIWIFIRDIGSASSLMTWI